MSKCCCKNKCCKEYANYQECLCEYGGYGYGGHRGGSGFSLLIILVLILLFFGNKCGKGRGDDCCERSGLGLSGGIIFIITLFYLACGCGGFGGYGY